MAPGRRARIEVTGRPAALPSLPGVGVNALASTLFSPSSLCWRRSRARCCTPRYCSDLQTAIRLPDLTRAHCAWRRVAARLVRQHRLTKHLRRITILLHAVSGTARPALFSQLQCSSNRSRSLNPASRSRRRRRTSQLAAPAPFAPAPLRQELNTLAA